jgi:hypothetical protein
MNNRLPPNIIVFIEKDLSFSWPFEEDEETSESDELPILYISIFADGTVNRSGSINDSLTGIIDSEYNTTIVMGVSENELYEQLLGVISQELVDLSGEHYLTEEKVPPYHLYISIEKEGSEGIYIHYYYGSDSEPIPSVAQEFVMKATFLTEEWDRRKTLENSLAQKAGIKHNILRLLSKLFYN